MNVAWMAQQSVALLSPFLPKLLGFAGKVTEGAAKELGGDLWEKAKSLWNQIGSKLKKKEAAAEALSDLAKRPDDEDARTVLRVQIAKLLTQDKDLARDLSKWFHDTGVGITIQAIGERSVAAQQISGGTIITGDQGVTPRGKPIKRKS